MESFAKPDADAEPGDFIATLPTASLYLHRLQWSRQIEEPDDRVQSDAEVPTARSNTRRWPQLTADLLCP
jgi:hypothetical protein